MAYNVIYTFHMPLFVFISGYFTHTNKSNYFSSVGKIAETLIIFQAIHLAISAAQKGPSSLTFLTPAWTLWYLLSLIFWRIFIYYACRFIHNKKNIVVLSIFLALLAGCVPLSQVLAFQRTFYFLPFFCLGYCLSNKDFVGLIKKHVPVYLPICCFALIIAVAIITSGKYSGVFRGSGSYHNLYSPAQRIVTLLTGLFASISFVKLMPLNSTFLARTGKQTLFIYMWHSLIVKAACRVVDHFNLPVSIPFMLLYFAGIMLILFAMYKVRFFRLMLNPVSRLHDKFARKR